jgi:hypothetical protein
MAASEHKPMAEQDSGKSVKPNTGRREVVKIMETEYI